jgi:hypothetical protein
MGKGGKGGGGGGGASGGSNASKGASSNVGSDNTSNKRKPKEDVSWLWILALVAICIVACAIFGPPLVSSMIKLFKPRKSDTFI